MFFVEIANEGEAINHSTALCLPFPISFGESCDLW
jgi:hypothetical protein